jgi:hypothetical protein
MNDWGRSTAVSIARYIQGEEQAVLRDHPLLALLQQRGRVEFNVSGNSVEKRLKIRQAPLIGYADGDTLNYQRRNRWVVASLDHRGYYVSDSYGKVEKLANRGKERIVDLVGGMSERLMEDLRENFAMQLYVDGYATGNEKFLCGLESIFGNSGAATNGFVAINSDTYAGLSTALSDKGGSWGASGGATTWPLGRGSSEYDYFSPLIVDYTDGSWAAGTKTWPNTCGEAMRFALHYSEKNVSSKGRTDLILLDRELHRQFLDANDTKQVINVNRGQDVGPLTGLGFGKAINYDGASLITGFGLPYYNSAPLGYGLNVDQIQLWSMQGQLFVPTMYEDEPTKSTNLDIDFLGNMWINPRYQFTLRKVT